MVLRSDESEEDALFSTPWDDNITLLCLKEKGSNIYKVLLRFTS